MLRLSKKTDYAIILLSHLGGSPIPVSAQEVSTHYRLPQPMAANILKQLASAGMTESVRGQRGGYILSRNAESITLAEIVQAMDGEFNLVECVHEEDRCKVAQNCPTRGPLTALHRRIQHFMEETTLSSIITEGLIEREPQTLVSKES
jgi:Rrf2 family protein